MIFQSQGVTMDSYHIITDKHQHNHLYMWLESAKRIIFEWEARVILRYTLRGLKKRLGVSMRLLLTAKLQPLPHPYTSERKFIEPH